MGERGVLYEHWIYSWLFHISVNSVSVLELLLCLAHVCDILLGTNGYMKWRIGFAYLCGIFLKAASFDLAQESNINKIGARHKDLESTVGRGLCCTQYKYSIISQVHYMVVVFERAIRWCEGHLHEAYVFVAKHNYNVHGLGSLA